MKFEHKSKWLAANVALLLPRSRLLGSKKVNRDPYGLERGCVEDQPQRVG